MDSYIAWNDDFLDWLLKCKGRGDNGYTAFYENVDTILLGRRTYEGILKNVQGAFPYEGKECYVFSRTLREQTANVTFLNQNIARFTACLKNKPGQNIWIVGGQEILIPLFEQNLVDEFIIHVAPAIIGQGILLFKPGSYEMTLQLLKVTQYNEFVELYYQRT